MAALNKMPWFWRRIFVGAIIFWSMTLLTYLGIVGSDNLRGDIAFYVSGVLISTLGSYLGIATWDNKNERRANLAAAVVTPTDPSTSNVDVDVNMEVKP